LNSTPSSRFLTDGKIIENPFTNLEPGRYRLTETKAHPGYNLLSKSIDIEFTQGGKYKIDDGTAKNATGDAASGYTVTLTVLNRKTPELPHTGADAPSLWLLIGMPLAVAGLLIFTSATQERGPATLTIPRKPSNPQDTGPARQYAPVYGRAQP